MKHQLELIDEISGLRKQVSSKDLQINSLTAERDELKMALAKMWIWQGHSQGLVSDDLSNEVKSLLGELASVKCECGQPAVCYGSYEGSEPAFSCDECCGHGCEDGACSLLIPID